MRNHAIEVWRCYKPRRVCDTEHAPLPDGVEIVLSARGRDGENRPNLRLNEEEARWLGIAMAGYAE